MSCDGGRSDARVGTCSRTSACTRDSGGDNKTVLSSQALESAFLSRAAILNSRYDVVYGRPESLIPPTKMEIDVKRQEVRVMAPRWVTK